MYARELRTLTRRRYLIMRQSDNDFNVMKPEYME